MGTGVFIIVHPLMSAYQRGSVDQTALNTWIQGGSQRLPGAVPGAPQGPEAVHPACGSSSPTDYALVSFTGISQYNYAGVAGDGGWDLLNNRSMVHYAGSPAPGQQGNVIVAFHREPDFEHIDQLSTGGDVTIQDRSCHTFRYRVTQKWVLAPDRVTQLIPTSGHDLTLITCTPFWQDTERIVWRATLVA